MSSKKASFDDRLLGLVNRMEAGKVDDLTFVQSMEALYDSSDKATNPRSFIRFLERDRRRQFDLVKTLLRRVGRDTRDINMMRVSFKEDEIK